MKTSLKFLTEEGRTKSKNTFRRILVYAALMIVAGLLSAYAVHRYWIRNNFTPLQRVYFKQYVKSAAWGTLPNSRSDYITLARTVTDPRTKKDVSLAVRDDEIKPVFDDEGYIQLDKSGYPLLLLKPGIEHKEYRWLTTKNRDAEMHAWLCEHFYEGQSLTEIYQPAWLGGLLVFFFGTGGLTALDLFAQRRYLKGEAVRGTRQLRPKEYVREHRKEVGYGVKVYAPGGGK
jgi:hypothetical protein